MQHIDEHSLAHPSRTDQLVGAFLSAHFKNSEHEGRRPEALRPCGSVAPRESARMLVGTLRNTMTLTVSYMIRWPDVLRSISLFSPR